MASSILALRQAIRDTDPHRLQNIVLKLCASNPQSRSFVERMLLSRGGNSATHYAQTATSEGRNSFMDKSEPLRPEDSRSDGVKWEDDEDVLNPLSGTIFQCQNCDMSFRIGSNRKDSCRYHQSRRKTIDRTAAVWAGHDENTWGKPESLMSDPRFASGFFWACCKRPLNYGGCFSTYHTLPTNDARITPQQHDSYTLSHRGGRQIKPAQHPTAVSGKSGDGSHRLPLEESELFKSAQRRAAEAAGTGKRQRSRNLFTYTDYSIDELATEQYSVAEAVSIAKKLIMGAARDDLEAIMGPSSANVSTVKTDTTNIGGPGLRQASSQRSSPSAIVKRKEGRKDDRAAQGSLCGSERPRKKIKLEDGTYIKREEGVATAGVMGKMDELGASGKRIKLEDGTFIKREEGIEGANTDDGHHRRKPRAPRRPGTTPRGQHGREPNSENDMYVKHEEGY